MEESHHWVTQPHTVYERRRELRVRESRHTFMLADKKYFNYETGKYDSDKIKTLYSQSYSDLIEDDNDYTGQHLGRSSWAAGKNIYIERQKKYEKFSPKDNDFDDECRQDEIRKSQEKIKEDYNKKCQALIDARIARDLQETIEREQRQREYQAQAREYAESRIRQYDNGRNMPIMCGIRPNCWRPK